MFELHIALRTLVVLTIALAFLFVYLLGYTYWTRKKNEYWQRYEQKFRNYFFPLLLDYAEQTGSYLEADEIINKLSDRTRGYSFFLKLLDELREILDGEEHERLGNFWEHKIFISFYMDKLYGFSAKAKKSACIYFQNTGNLDERTLARLIMVSKSSDLKLAYAATKALQSAEDFSVRKSALLRFFQRNDISELMVAELLHLFDSDDIEKREEVEKACKTLLTKDIGIVSKSIIVRYLGYQKFYHSSQFLCQFLKRLQYTVSKSILIRALIVGLGELRDEEASSLIRSYVGRREVDVSTKLAAVKSLSKIGKEEDLIFLMKFLFEAEFAVRKAIIYALALNEESRIKLLDQFIVSNLHFIDQMKDQQHLSGQIKTAVAKIKDITLGIKIALNHRLTRAFT